MSSPKVEKAIALVNQIEATRLELQRLETEFEELVSSPRRREAKEAKPGRHLNGVHKSKPSRNRLKTLKILKAAGVPMKLKDIQKKLGISDSGTASILNQLIKAGEAIRSGYGLYAKA